MNLEELLAMLELSQPSDFEYFEDMAGIMECDEDIPVSVLDELFSEADAHKVGEVLQNYFEEILEALPDESTDVYLLLENIKRALIGLLMSREEGDDSFSVELDRFRRWYCFDSRVDCHPVEEGDEQQLPLREALVLARLQQMSGDEYHYDFDACLDYELDEYMMDLAMQTLADEDDEDMDLADLDDTEEDLLN